MTIQEATATNSAIVMMGLNQIHHIGRVCYRFKKREKLNIFCGKEAKEVYPKKARGVPVIYRDGNFVETQLGKPIMGCCCYCN